MTVSRAAREELISDVVHWGTTTLCFSYRLRSRRKSLAITVHPDLRIVVTAPTGTPAEVIRAKVLKRARWITKTRREFEQFHPLQPARSYIPGEAHRYLGQQCRLKVAKGRTSSVTCIRGQLLVTMPSQPTPSIIRPLVEAWLKDRAHAVFTERLKACHKPAQRYNIPFPCLWIRPMTIRWGSCTPAGRIILNIELIKAPKDCIDYVITHELCHLLEPSHSARFWQLLGAIMPDWEERRGRLNKMADI